MTPLLNRPRAERILEEAGVDAVVATTAANVRYLSGYQSFSQLVNPFAQVYALARSDSLDRVTLVAPIGDLDVQAQLPAPLAEIHPYGRFFVEPSSEEAELSEEARRYRALAAREAGGTPESALLEELTRLAGGARVALDERAIAPAVLERVRSALGGRVVPGAGLFERIRMVKVLEEVRRLEAAARAVETSYEAALEAARPGISEAELATIFDRRTVEQGSRPHFTVLAFGERGAFPNAIPSPQRRLALGDVIRFDVGCRTEGYCSDIARTAVLGEPAPRVARAYQAILAGEEAMIRAMRPGITAAEVFEVATRATREAGLPRYRRHHVGHGVGLDTYDPPLLAPEVETPLEEGMVLEVETPYYELGFAGLQVEDTVVVTSSGVRLLTRTPRGLRVVGRE